MRRATVGERSPATHPEKTESEKPAPKRRTTWLTRSPSNASLVTSESSKEVVQAEPASSSSFWKLPQFPSSSSSSSNTTPAPTNTTANANANANATITTTSVVPVPAAPEGEGAQMISPYPLHSRLILIQSPGSPSLQSPRRSRKRRSGYLTPATPSTSSRPSTPR